MDTPDQIISDKEIDTVHTNAHFGPSYTKREVVNFAVLKLASGYYQGHTSRQIIKEHGLATDTYELTTKGRAYLWAVYSKGDNF